MARVKRGVTAHARHKKVLEKAAGFYGRRKNTIRAAKAAVDKAGQYAYRDRKVRKRSFRSLWIQRINAAARLEGMTYARFIHGLELAGVQMDRKVLADIFLLACRRTVTAPKPDLPRRPTPPGTDPNDRYRRTGIRQPGPH
jgi:large subunit ribosomal protein L20